MGKESTHGSTKRGQREKTGRLPLLFPRVIWPNPLQLQLQPREAAPNRFSMAHSIQYDSLSLSLSLSLSSLHHLEAIEWPLAAELAELAEWQWERRSKGRKEISISATKSNVEYVKLYILDALLMPFYLPCPPASSISRRFTMEKAPPKLNNTSRILGQMDSTLRAEQSRAEVKRGIEKSRAERSGRVQSARWSRSAQKKEVRARSPRAFPSPWTSCKSDAAF